MHLVELDIPEETNSSYKFHNGADEEMVVEVHRELLPLGFERMVGSF